MVFYINLHTSFARDFVHELGVDPGKIQRVFRFRKTQDNHETAHDNSHEIFKVLHWLHPCY